MKAKYLAVFTILFCLLVFPVMAHASILSTIKNIFSPSDSEQLLGGRTDNYFNLRLGTYLETVSPTGYDLLINGVSKYLNFGSISGSSGYGFRDNSGTMEYKNNGGAWAGVGTGGTASTSFLDLTDTPSAYTGQAGKVATVNAGENALEFTAVGGTGTVTNVGMVVPAGFSVSGVPITAAGTSTISYAAGYSLPLTASTTEGSTAYTWGNHASAGYLSSALTNGYFFVGNASNVAVATSSMFMSAAGNIGIGTTTPSNKLVVSGMAKFVQGTTSANVEYYNTNASAYTAFDMFDSTNTKGGTVALSGSSASLFPGAFWLGSRNSNPIYFTTGSSPAVRMTVENSGNVGIGTVDFDGTPAIGRLVVKGSTNDGSTNVLVARDSDEANVLTIDSNGVITTGGVTSTNWNTAYGWGDHASAGYLTENDSITLSGDASGTGTSTITVAVADDSHNHSSTTISNLVAADFASANISQWTNDSGYSTFTQAQATSTLVSRSDWTTIDNYPSACSAGQYVSAIGDTLTCGTPAGGGTPAGATGQLQYNNGGAFGASSLFSVSTSTELLTVGNATFGNATIVRALSVDSEGLLVVPSKYSASNNGRVGVLVGTGSQSATLAQDYDGTGLLINQKFTEASSGNHPLIASLGIVNPTITTGAATVSNAANLYIQNEPTVTVSGGNYAIFVDNGKSRFDGDILLYGTSTARFYDTDSSNYVGLKASTTVASDITWTLPVADGTANQVLQTNGAGLLSWATSTGSLDIVGLTATTTAIDADVMPIYDSGSSANKKITWANIKATLKTYFDTLYQAIGKLTASANPTIDDAGDAAINTTAASSSVRFYDGTAERALYPDKEISFIIPYASATTTASTTLPFAFASVHGETWNSITCNTATSSADLEIGDGTNWMNYLTIGTTTTTTTLNSNNVFTTREQRYLRVGQVAGNYINISCTANAYKNAD